MRFRNLVAIAVLGLLPALAHASSFTYNFNDHFSSFSLTGTMTTDTNSGALSTGDITGYNLILNDGSTSLNLTQANSQEEIFGANAVKATAAGLFFNFNDTTGNIFVIQSPFVGAGTNYVCYQGAAAGCDDFSSAHESIRLGSDGQRVAQLSGNREIASATAVTPEPESLVLLGTGIVAMAGVVRRKIAA